MTESEGMHVPSPEFVAALERELVDELRAAAPARRGWLRLGRPLARHERIAATILLAIGLTVGAGAQIAVAQVQGAQQQSELEREILAMRLMLARQERDRARDAVRSGAAMRESALQAEAEVKEREFAMLRIEMDLAEIQRTRKPPRDELWAPKVGDRDFVLERLRLEAAAAQEQLKLAEARSQARVEAARAGNANRESESETVRERVRAQREFERVAQALISREEFFRERLTVEQVTQRTQANQLGADYRAARALLDIAQKQLAVVRQRYVVGAATEIEVKRAELEGLERRAEVERLAVQLQAFDRRPH